MTREFCWTWFCDDICECEIYGVFVGYYYLVDDSALLIYSLGSDNVFGDY